MTAFHKVWSLELAELCARSSSISGRPMRDDGQWCCATLPHFTSDAPRGPRSLSRAAWRLLGALQKKRVVLRPPRARRERMGPFLKPNVRSKHQPHGEAAAPPAFSDPARLTSVSELRDDRPSPSPPLPLLPRKKGCVFEPRRARHIQEEKRKSRSCGKNRSICCVK